MATRKKPEQLQPIKDTPYKQLTLQDPLKVNWFDILDEDGCVLMRISIAPRDAYHKAHGRIGLAYNSEDHEHTMHW